MVNGFSWPPLTILTPLRQSWSCLTGRPWCVENTFIVGPSRIEFGDPVDLSRPSSLGVLVHVRIRAGEQRFCERRAVLGWERKCSFRISAALRFMD
jgi:hypothetical protein